MIRSLHQTQESHKFRTDELSIGEVAINFLHPE